MSQTSAPGLIVLSGAARSGTTLLRLLLDAHPQIGCPAEAGLPGFIDHHARVWATVANSADAEQTDPRSGILSAVPGAGREAIRSAARAVMKHYCTNGRKRLYVDKSLDSVHHFGVVQELFPDTRYILLFRHVMDTVASGVEAAPWGFRGYGYAPYVQASPENFVAALAQYWLGHVRPALQWEAAHPGICHRVTYEDLVTAPDETVSALLEFLGVDIDTAILTTGLRNAAQAVGPGDYKVTHTSVIETASVGRGKMVPVAQIPPPLLAAVNENLTQLGYEALTQAWNAEPVSRVNEMDDAGSHRRLLTLMQNLIISDAHGSPGDIGSFALVTQDHEALRWVVDATARTIRQGDGDVCFAVTGSAEDLAALVTQETNAGVLLRSGRVRHITAGDDARPNEVIRDVQAVTRILRPAPGDGGASDNGGPRDGRTRVTA